MKTRTTLILLAVAVAAAVYIKFYESKGPNTEESKRLAGNVVNFERDGLEGIMAKRADSQYLSGARTDNWLKIKTSKRQEVVIAGFTAPRRTRPCFGALALAIREGKEWRFIGHVGTGFSHAALKELHGKLSKLKTASSPSTRQTSIWMVLILTRRQHFSMTLPSVAM